MHIGKSYRVSEFLYWTRRSILQLLFLGSLPVVLYQIFDVKWIAIPWPVAGLLGTATAFIVGFKNVQTYNRTWEARQVWGAAISASRAWAMMSKDFIKDRDKAREIIYRHFAWLTALRYQLRSEKSWETTGSAHNREYKRFYSIPENEIPIEAELSKYISKKELETILHKNNKATQLLNLQGDELRKLNEQGQLEEFRFLAMHKALDELSAHQGKNERIKNFPYPRQYSTINAFFVKLFCILLPFAMLGEFSGLNKDVDGVLKGNMVWFVIPFSILISWMYISLDQVGESTSNPFEGSPNDIPITQMSRSVEIDIREMLAEADLPPVLSPQNNIVL